MGHPKHPIFSGSTFGLMSGEKPLFQPQVEGGHEALGGALQQMGLYAEPTSGKYQEPERSYIIHGASLDQMKQLGKMFGQESVIHSQNGQHRLIYTNGENEGQYHPAEPQNPIEHFEQPPPDFYTSVPGHGHFRINFDWNQKHHLDPVNKAEREFEPELAAHLLKNAVAQLLAAQAPTKAHPHFYDWHDGHSSHHAQDLAAPQLLDLNKADAPGPHPHMDTPPKPVNDQAAGVGVATYKQFALPYGNVSPGSKSDLLHYPYHGKLPEVEGLVQDHGFKTYYAGGKYGKPDLANKNYNTGHLMVYDPSPSSGGDFGHEHYTSAWRQIHELSHALTLPELNKIYGEGRRMGKLGVHRTTHEALRAVHWEWLAAHKQRELSKQIGVNIKDEDFHKELNTVMHDAAHRAVTGKFTEPSDEGFSPHAHKVPLHTALQMVRDSAHQMGLQGLHDLVSKGGMKKSAPAVIFSKTEGDTNVANEKMYSAEEAREILLKATREKVDAYAKEIEALRSRELGLAKSLIPNHKHNQGSQASSGVEDVAPGKMNGKGIDKSMAKEELCKQCGKPHELDKCGDMTTVGEAKKSELVDAKGNKKDNHTVAGSKLPPDAGKHVNKPGKTSKTAGSGGVILPGANLKKSGRWPPDNRTNREVEADRAASNERNKEFDARRALADKTGRKLGDIKSEEVKGKTARQVELEKAATPPMAKPPSGANMGTSVPTSAPKAPKAPMSKGMMAEAAKRADPISASHAATQKAPVVKLPTPAQHADRAAGFQAAMSGAFQPPAPKPAVAAKPLGLASPKAAGVTRSAGPVMNAARPAPAARPGIFGKLAGVFGKSEEPAEKKSGTCGHCGNSIPVLEDGKMVTHTGPHNRPCPDSGHKPKK